MDSLPNFVTHGAPLRALRAGAPLLNTLSLVLSNQHVILNELEAVVAKAQSIMNSRPADVFWRRWLREYVLTLQKHHKWFSFCRDLKEDDLVVIVDENIPRGQ